MGPATAIYLDDNAQAFPDFAIASTSPGASAGYSQDRPRWSDLAAFAAAGQGNSAWFNVLPCNVGQKPLCQYAADPSPFVNGRTVLNCPAGRLFPSNRSDHPRGLQLWHQLQGDQRPGTPLRRPF